MPDIIHLLPDAVANQIAAGEVIQRPASVLKELVENAIDAEATRITIEIKDAGKTLLRVADNGKGMSSTDARMAFERHATSKIKTADDLMELCTMGFRGEALPSIASVAQVELRTRRKEDELGTLLVLAGSNWEKQEAVNCPYGSTFDVKNLFFNVPARRRFLKSNTTELRNILTEFYRIALVNPQVAFHLISDGEDLFDLPSSSTKMRIDNLFGRGRKNLMQQLVSIETDTQIVKVRGFVGKPEGAQKSAHQFFFVNGRFMKHPYFHKAVINAYGNMLTQDDNPHYFIYFDVNPRDIDVNIHPTKTEIKFVDEQAIWSILNASVKEALGKFHVTDTIDFNQEGAIEMPVINPQDWQNIRAPQPTINMHYNPFESSRDYPRRKTMDWETLYPKQEETLTQALNFDEDERGIEADDSTQVTNWECVPELLESSIQIGDHYILLPTPKGIMLIDPKRAHARILYERYITQQQTEKGVSQQLLFPEEYLVPTEDMPHFEIILNELYTLGFDLEHLGGCTFQINGTPADLNNVTPQGVLDDILFAIKNSPTNVTEDYRNLVAKTLANATAIRSVQNMTSVEIKDLLSQLFKCQNHMCDADGRPIIVFIDKKEIDKRFNKA